METNQGLSYARNRGINEAQGDILIFLDDDAMVSSDYLIQLQKYIAEYPDMSAFGGKITPLFESGITPKWLSKWTYTLVSAINMGDAVREFKGNKYPIGANMGFRRSTLEKISFNTALGRTGKNLMAGEEKDIFNKIKAESGKIYYFPYIAVQHVIPASRTTVDFVKRMGQGVGKSERLRSLNVSKFAYLKRLFAEGVKWAASIVLFLGYLLTGRLSKGSILLAFRYQVTKGLLNFS